MTIISCGSKSDPKEVATNFLNARNKMDYETAKKFGTDETDKMLDMTASLSSMIPDSVKELTKNAKVVIKGEPKIEGDKATVIAESTIGGDTKEETIDLVKKDGTWLVNMSKGDLGEGDMNGNAENGATPPTEETVPVEAGKDSVAAPKN